MLNKKARTVLQGTEILRWDKARDSLKVFIRRKGHARGTDSSASGSLPWVKNGALRGFTPTLILHCCNSYLSFVNREQMSSVPIPQRAGRRHHNPNDEHQGAACASAHQLHFSFVSNSPISLVQADLTSFCVELMLPTYPSESKAPL
jgi:hypothetical protein